MDKKLNVPVSELVTITGIKFNVKCKHCASSWGIYLTEDGNVPEGWNVCLKCASKKLNVKENVQNVSD